MPLEKVETVGGYQVKVSYRPASVGDSQSRAKTVCRGDCRESEEDAGEEKLILPLM